MTVCVTLCCQCDSVCNIVLCGLMNFVKLPKLFTWSPVSLHLLLPMLILHIEFSSCCLLCNWSNYFCTNSCLSILIMFMIIGDS